MKRTMRRMVIWALGTALALVSGQGAATALSISQVPLFVGGGVAPNIMVVMDDSGSMHWAYMPDDIFWDYNDARGLAYRRNKMAYNPWVKYDPPLKPDGTPYPDANFNAAWDDGYRAAMGQSTCKKNLANNYRPSWDYGDNCNGFDEWWWPEYHWLQEPDGRAFYYVWYEDHPAGPQPKPAGCNGTTADNDCYIKVRVTSTSGPGGSDERTNFANWYSYYRRRSMSAKMALGRAFALQGTGIRVGYGAINEGTKKIDGVNTPVIKMGVRPFSGTDRTNFFGYLYKEDASGGTPLRYAADKVGEYFLRTDSKGPWSTTPGSSGGKDLVCRQSFLILMTDGYWNSSAADGGAADNNDGTSGPTHTAPDGSSYTYTPASPFKDSRSNTLADVAMYYWKNDLRTDLANEVPKSSLDPAFWQHLVTFGISFGITGTVDPATAFDAITTGATINWPDPNASNPAKIDDLLHAAVNGRGAFFSTDDAGTLAAALNASLLNIFKRIGTAASVALNTGAVTANSRLYQALFNSGNWTGDLKALNINSDGSVGSTAWTAASKVDAQDWNTGREILTYNPSSGQGVPFRWPSNPGSPGAGEISAAQVAALKSGGSNSDGKARLEYLRGSTANEQPSGSFRTRVARLGDIVHSDPYFVGDPPYSYPDVFRDAMYPTTTGSEEKYSDFRIARNGRTKMVYVGANDGMLHGFDAETGEEKLAYVPAELFDNLAELTDPSYSHRYYVDGGPVVVDAFGNFPACGGTPCWRTVLVSGLRAGGQGIFALDVTDPSTFDEANAAKIVLWEFRDDDDPDLGYTFSQPHIVRLHNGKWAAVFGNGYGSEVADGVQGSGEAYLYIVDLATGNVIRKIGPLTDPGGLSYTGTPSSPNGLSTPAPVDVDGDWIVDYVYAGDLRGNLWKFDLTDQDPANWDVAYKSGSTPKPLFTACTGAPCSTTNRQPITVRPEVGLHPTYTDTLMVYFGTGKYFETGDNTATGQATQTFYGIWDRGDIGFDRDDLLQQKITSETSQTFTTAGGSVSYELRQTTNNPITWDSPGGAVGPHMGWYLDLVNTGVSPLDNKGERVVANPVLRNGRIIFTTLLPSDDPCAFGGDSWLMELDAVDGSRLDTAPFDLNADGVFNLEDAIDTDGDGVGDTAPSGRKSKVGIIPTPGILSQVDTGCPTCKTKEVKYMPGSSGKVETVTESGGEAGIGRQSWREIVR